MTSHHEDRRRAGSFGEDAERYDRARPSYPAALFDDLVGQAPTGPVPRVLDVGCGTGIAARALVARGCAVVGVEHDERMAALARTHGLEVEVATFESWDAGGRQFDLVTAAQSWHWIEPVQGARRAAAALCPGGRWAGFWNLAVHDPAAEAALDAVYELVAPDLRQDSVTRLATMHPELVGAELDAFAATGGFEEHEMRSYAWTRHYSTDEWLDQLGTHSNHRVLPAATLEALLDEIGVALDGLGGSIEVRYDTVLYTLVRRRGSAERGFSE